METEKMIETASYIFVFLYRLYATLQTTNFSFTENFILLSLFITQIGFGVWCQSEKNQNVFSFENSTVVAFFGKKSEKCALEQKERIALLLSFLVSWMIMSQWAIIWQNWFSVVWFYGEQKANKCYIRVQTCISCHEWLDKWKWFHSIFQIAKPMSHSFPLCK